MSMFQKATKRAVRARIALDGPSGSGKTWTALTFAAVFGQKTALVDTERGSASLYADVFDFDVIELSPPFHPDRLIDLIKSAEKDGYDTLVIDSLSHFWEGEGGTLDLADAAGRRENGNTWAGWKAATPVLRHVIDTILAADVHVICTMRTKTEWTTEEYTDRNGQKKTKPVRIGLAPVMRAGMEYEFTVVGDLDLEHRLSITKSRAAVLADQVIQPGRAGDAAEAFVAWTRSGAQVASKEQIDGLKQRMNRIEPKDIRVAAKQSFADQFGNPDYLLADKIPAAEAFISGYEGGDGPPDDGNENPIKKPGGGESANSGGSPVAEAEASPAGDDSREVVRNAPEPSDAQAEGDRGTTAAASSPGSSADPEQVPDLLAALEASLAAARPEPKPKRQVSPGQQLHKDLGVLGFTKKDDQQELIFCVSSGRTVHASELDGDELGLAYYLGKDIAEGRRTMADVLAANDEYRQKTLDDQLEASMADARGEQAVADYDLRTAS